MVIEQNGPNDQLSDKTAAFLPLKYAALCADEEGHVYDASRSPNCPACGTYDRLMVATALSPKILHPRLMGAMRVKVSRER